MKFTIPPLIERFSSTEVVEAPRLWGSYNPNISQPPPNFVVEAPRLWGSYNPEGSNTQDQKVVEAPRLWGSYNDPVKRIEELRKAGEELKAERKFNRIKKIPV